MGLLIRMLLVGSGCLASASEDCALEDTSLLIQNRLFFDHGQEVNASTNEVNVQTQVASLLQAVSASLGLADASHCFTLNDFQRGFLDGPMISLPCISTKSMQREEVDGLELRRLLGPMLLIGLPVVAAILITLCARMFDVHEFWFAAVIWGGTSLAMNILNKLAVTVLPLPFTLIIVQMLIADVVLVISLGPRSIIDEVGGKVGNVGRWSLLVIPFAGMLLTSMMALHAGAVMNLLVYRGALPLITMFLERIFRPSEAILISVTGCVALALILCGTFVYGFGEKRSAGSWVSLTCILLNMVCTVIHRLAERSLLVDQTMKLSFAVASVVNNTIGIAPIAIFAFIFGEHREWARIFGSSSLYEARPMAYIIFSGLAGLGLGYFSIVTQKLLTATSHLVMQTAMRVLTIVAVVVLLGENLSWTTFAGCALVLAGSVWHSSLQLKPSTKL